MALATKPPAQRGPTDRLPRTHVLASRGREIRTGVAGAAGLTALVVGIPALLVLFVGYPLPRSAPSQDWLTQTISATLIIKVLAVVVWVVWAHFCVCVISEWRALRQGRLPSTVPFGGGSQLVARRLAAAALLLTGIATAFPHGAGSPSTPQARPAVTAAAGAQMGVAGLGAVRQVPGQLDSPPPPEPGGASTPAPPAAQQAAKYYVVEPPAGQRHDCLWDIAERTMGNPLRYKEIFALNKDRTQADGSRLVDANLIRPGWELRLPADASGPGVHIVHASAPVTSPRAAPKSAADAGGAGSAGDRSGNATTPIPQTAPLAGHAAAQSTRASTGSPESMIFGGALMLAGVVVALSARRGPFVAQDDEEEELTTAAQSELAASLDIALRHLADARGKQERELPQPIVAWVSDDQVTLNLAGGDKADPPAPWQLADGGRSWRCQLAAFADMPVPADDVAAPFPGLLSVGRQGEHDLFVDFEQAPGLVSLCGDLERGRECATALAVHAATSRWSDGARVTVVGFSDGAELAKIDPSRVDQVDHLLEVMDTIERDHDDLLRLQRQLGVDGVLSGRQSRRSASWQPHALVLSGPPTPAEERRLAELVGAGRSNVVVLVVGDTPGARWRFVLDAQGGIDLGVLGAAAQAHRLSRAGAANLVALLVDADQSKHEQTQAVAGLTPRSAVARTGGRGTGAGTRRRSHRAREQQPAATVSLLGPVEVDAQGPLEPAKRALATEIVVAIALHPDGIRDAVLQASIWPRGVSDEVFAAALADVSRWLGVDSAGQPCLVQQDGSWLLAESVCTDADELRRVAAMRNSSDELALLVGAVHTFRGPAFSATPPGRYSWLTFARSARDARIVGTSVARRAAAMLVEHHRLDAAEDVLRRGLELVPTADPLWRDLLELAGRRGPDPAAAVAKEMYDTLQRWRAWPEPETEALVAQLAPGHSISQPA